MTNCHLMETQNLVISFDYSWFLAKNLAYAECLILKFHYRNSSNNNPWFKPWFNILLHTQSIVIATVNSQCLEYLGYITLSPGLSCNKSDKSQCIMMHQLHMVCICINVMFRYCFVWELLLQQSRGGALLFTPTSTN